MDNGLAGTKQEYVGDTDFVATCRGYSRTHVNRRWRVFAPILALVFATVISSCEEKADTEKHAAEGVLQLLPESAAGTFDRSTESLLHGAEIKDTRYKEAGIGEAGIIAVEAEIRKERLFGMDLLCLAKISRDRNNGTLYVSVSVPVSEATYEDRKKEAESDKARDQVIECHKLFRVKLPPKLAGAKSSDMSSPAVGIGAARASNGGTCPQWNYGSCDTGGSGGCCPQ